MKTILFIICSVISVATLNAQDLEGVISRNDLETEPYNEWFSKNYDVAHPNDATFLKLHKALQGKSITIVMGTWCGDSKIYVPYFFKLMDLVKTDIPIKIIAINKEKKAKGVDLNKYDIKRIPTFIVYDEKGKELGRIVESPRYSIEDDLLDILNKNGKE